MMMLLHNTPKKRLIFKVLVLGSNTALATGFMREASGRCFSSQLQSTIGVAIGVGRATVRLESEVVFQLWLLTEDARFQGLMSAFIRGHRAVIVVVPESDIQAIPRVISLLPDFPYQKTAFVVVSDEPDQAVLDSISELLGQQVEYVECGSVQDVIDMQASCISCSSPEGNTLPFVTVLPTQACPPHVEEPPASLTTPSSPEEVDEVRSTLLEMGLPTQEESIHVDLPEGTVTVQLADGRLGFQPTICSMCSESCKRETNICIVGRTTGWSSGNLGPTARLTLAKVVALATRNLPKHVEMQIRQASMCHNFNPLSEIPDELIERMLKQIGSEKKPSRIPLLDVALQRVAEGRLSKKDFEMLKRKFTRLTDQQ
ncbi:MAG: hypothetical protein DRP09_03735 [Candidatus Thorarchaeota archaeon]|nr:MAG: hypothetical protein DRP09_03735 [Candidatus Thorarchaeota archaeon]